MSMPAFKRATYQDVLNAPPHMVAEIIDGELYLHPRPGPRHSNAASVMGGDLRPLHRRRRGDDGLGGWWILDEPELHLDDAVIVPDLAGWHRERMPRLPVEAYFTLPPDWACEVLSPSTARLDRTKKKRVYAQHGVRHLWLVDPVLQTLEVLQLAGECWQEIAVFSGDERARAQPFEELELDLTQWWDEGEPEAETAAEE